VLQAELQNDITSLQSSVLDTRRKFNIRKHYDSEIERWITSLRVDVESSEVTFSNALEGTVWLVYKYMVLLEG
jgi:hypothetical protein